MELMKVVLFATLACLVRVECQTPVLTTNYFDQYIDHFNFGNSQKYKQRYLYTEKYWKEGSPLLFYTGNEGDITDFAANTGLMYEFAKNLSAYVVFAEHRYYGESLPFGNASLQSDKLGFLTIEQAMADFAYLIKSLGMKLGDKTPVICFGGSYGGMLSAYMRFKYPNLVLGAIASSAPIYSVANLGDQGYFFQDVAKDFENADTNCPSLIKSAFDKIGQLADQGKQGLDKLSSVFKLCQPMMAANEVDQMYGWIRNSLTFLAMLDYPYPTDFIGHLPAHPVNVACSYMVNSSNTLDGLAAVNAIFYNGTGSKTCSDMYADYMPCADPTGCGNSISWDYQACTEVVLPGGTDGISPSMFPKLPLTPDMRKTYCEMKYNVTPRTDWLGINMWGDDLGSATNIVFTNGDLDPWRRGGVTNGDMGSVEYYLIKGGAHHLDLRGSHSGDPQSVIDVREKELETIKRWLTDYQRQNIKKRRKKKEPSSYFRAGL